MRLRNKENNLTGYLTYIGLYIDGTEKENINLYIRLDNSDGECIDRQFYSLDELKKFLRDWEEVKEPLIKDEKIRKTVRAWADAIGVDDLFYCIDNRTRRAVFSWPGNDMAMELPAPIEGLATGRVYTTTELCGEEEE